LQKIEELSSKYTTFFDGMKNVAEDDLRKKSVSGSEEQDVTFEHAIPHAHFAEANNDDLISDEFAP